MAAMYYVYRNFSADDSTADLANGDLPQPSEHGWTRDNYDFVGWNTAQNGSGTMYQPGDRPDDTIPYYAIWSEQSHEVAIFYSGSQIASMDASGTKTLLTEGKYCEDDIVVQYTRYFPEVYAGEHHAELRLISFSMPDAGGAHRVCNAEPNMTFADWCASTYNTGFEARNWDAIGSQIVSGSWVLQLNGSNVLPTDTIQENAVYEQFYDD